MSSTDKLSKDGQLPSILRVDQGRNCCPSTLFDDHSQKIVLPAQMHAGHRRCAIINYRCGIVIYMVVDKTECLTRLAGSVGSRVASLRLVTSISTELQQHRTTLIYLRYVAKSQIRASLLFAA